MQITETFEAILALLEQLVMLTQGLVVIIFLQMLFIIAVAKNTQPRRELEPRKPSLFSRLRQRVRPKKKLPEGDTKELVT